MKRNLKFIIILVLCCVLVYFSAAWLISESQNLPDFILNGDSFGEKFKQFMSILWTCCKTILPPLILMFGSITIIGFDIKNFIGGIK